jgi:hypothetical protein
MRPCDARAARQEARASAPRPAAPSGASAAAPRAACPLRRGAAARQARQARPLRGCRQCRSFGKGCAQAKARWQVFILDPHLCHFCGAPRLLLAFRALWAAALASSPAAGAMASPPTTLADDLAHLEPKLARVLCAVAEACAESSAALRGDAAHAGAMADQNAFGVRAGPGAAAARAQCGCQRAAKAVVAACLSSIQLHRWHSSSQPPGAFRCRLRAPPATQPPGAPLTAASQPPGASADGCACRPQDTQIAADVITNAAFFDALRRCGEVSCAASEEESTPQTLNPGGAYSVRAPMGPVLPLACRSACRSARLLQRASLRVL